MALAGNPLIAEAVIVPARLPPYLETLKDLPVTFVGVRCPLHVAASREGQRDDRRSGPMPLTAEAFAAVHSHGAYDIEVDTTTATTDRLATDLAARIRSTPGVAFAQLRARTNL
jgi:chloramphenicol 3-O phosphotransferase